MIAASVALVVVVGALVASFLDDRRASFWVGLACGVTLYRIAELLA